MKAKANLIAAVVACAITFFALYGNFVSGAVLMGLLTIVNIILFFYLNSRHIKFKSKTL